MDDSQNPPDRIRIRPMTAADLDALAELERVTFARPWSYDALAEELQNPLAVFFVAEDAAAGDVLGYLGMHHILDEGAIDNLAVSPVRRRRGVGSALMRRAVGYAEEHRLRRLTLEVRVSNEPALALYRRFGFELDGVRPGFYDSPKEDAGIYSLYL